MKLVHHALATIADNKRGKPKIKSGSIWGQPVVSLGQLAPPNLILPFIDVLVGARLALADHPHGAGAVHAARQRQVAPLQPLVRYLPAGAYTRPLLS
jgi:hypothetical protein